jgi:hypothetical protein
LKRFIFDWKFIVFLFSLAAGLSFCWVTASAEECSELTPTVTDARALSVGECVEFKAKVVSEDDLKSDGKTHTVLIWKGGYTKAIRVLETGLYIKTCGGQQNKLATETPMQNQKSVIKVFSIANPNLNPKAIDEESLKPLSPAQAQIQMLELWKACTEYSIQEADRDLRADIVYRNALTNQ